MGMCQNTECMSDGQKQHKVSGPYVRDGKKLMFFRVLKAVIKGMTPLIHVFFWLLVGKWVQQRLE